MSGIIAVQREVSALIYQGFGLAFLRVVIICLRLLMYEVPSGMRLSGQQPAAPFQTIYDIQHTASCGPGSKSEPPTSIPENRKNIQNSSYIKWEINVGKRQVTCGLLAVKHHTNGSSFREFAMDVVRRTQTAFDSRCLIFSRTSIAVHGRWCGR